MMQYPDYDHSLLALTASVMKYYGVHTEHKSLDLFDQLLCKNYKNVVVMLFDGMGTSILSRHLAKDSFLRSHMLDSILSVFPPTTTAATKTMETGLAPIEHGWLGWSLYFHEIDHNVSVFPNTISGSDGLPAAEYHVGNRFLPNESIFDKITKATVGTVAAKVISPFSEYQSSSVEEICQSVKEICESEGPAYIYTYWPQPDYDMHEFGTCDEKITEE